MSVIVPRQRFCGPARPASLQELNASAYIEERCQSYPYRFRRRTVYPSTTAASQMLRINGEGAFVSSRIIIRITLVARSAPKLQNLVLEPNTFEWRSDTKARPPRADRPHGRRPPQDVTHLFCCAATVPPGQALQFGLSVRIEPPNQNLRHLNRTARSHRSHLP